MIKVTPRLKRLGVVAFAALAFSVSLYYTFPAQVVSMRIAQEVAKATNGQVRVRVGRAELWRLSGMAAHDVTLQIGDGQPLLIDAARVRLRLLPLILLRGSIYAQLQLGQGLAELVLDLGGEHAADVRLDAIDLTKPAWLARQLGAPVQGVISGTAALSGVPRWGLVHGLVEMTFERMSVGPMTLEGVGLPQVGLGQLTLALDINDGQARIASFKQTGGNISVEGRGKIALAEPLDSSSLDVCAKVRVEQSFLVANPKLGAAVHLAEVQLKRDPAGFLNIPLAGTLRTPSLRPGLCPSATR